MNDSSTKILILGASGFVGRNLYDILSHDFAVFCASRRQNIELNNSLVFDIDNFETWETIYQIEPDYIINCIGYGVVKSESALDKMYSTNYFNTIKFYQSLSIKLPKVKLIHIGTAFEYDLHRKSLTEDSPTLPLTHYGISKLMASNYLMSQKNNWSFVILRVFNMFGMYEDYSKIIPYLILSQKHHKVIPLSIGEQKRDYFGIDDLSRFVKQLIQNNNFKTLPSCINVGTGETLSIKEIAKKLIPHLPHYNPSLWNWGAFETRAGEALEFYNSSSVAKQHGFKSSNIDIQIKKTIEYYWNI